MKLPYRTKEILTNVLNQKNPNSTPNLFSVFFIEGAFSPEGELSLTTVKPRFIVFYSDNKEEFDKANRRVNHFLGDAFKYTSKEDGELPEEYSDMTGFLLFRRSRALNSAEFNLIYDSLSEEKFMNTIFDILFKSTFMIEVEEKSVSGNNFFTTKTRFVPSIGTIEVDSGDIALRSMPESVERVLNDPHAGTYEQIIDYNFDTCYIKTNRFQGEISPPKTCQELVTLVRKNLLINTEHPKSN